MRTKYLQRYLASTDTRAVEAGLARPDASRHDIVLLRLRIWQLRGVIHGWGTHSPGGFAGRRYEVQLAPRLPWLQFTTQQIEPWLDGVAVGWADRISLNAERQT